MKRIVIAAGGTAGHVVPALAVADELRASGARVSFVGTRDRAEAQLVPDAGYEIDFLSVTGIDRDRPLRAAMASARAVAAVPAALRLLRRRDADAVLGGGGYVAGPVGMAAAARRTPLVLTEADSHLGLANRTLAPFAKRVCLSFAIPGLEGRRYAVTGRAVARAVVEADRSAARDRLGIAPDATCLLIFGGSLGARTINEAAFDAFSANPLEGTVVVHITGSRDWHELSARLEQAGNPPDYRLYEYLPTLADVLAACDLVVCRSGGSVFELTAAGCPAILVPYPRATAGHQLQNARWMADAGAAVIVPDDQLDGEKLRELCERLIDDAEAIEAMSSSSRALARPDAAARIAGELLAVAEAGK